MQTFKNKPDGFSEVRKKLLLRTVPLLTLAVVVGVAISNYNAPAQQAGTTHLAFLIPTLFIILILVTFNTLKRQKEIFDSFALHITETELIRSQLHHATLTLPHAEVSAIIKNKNGSIIIKGRSKGQIIVILPQIENYSRIEHELETIKPITRK